MKYCPYCHSKLYENDDYCLNCGRMLKKKRALNRFDHIETTFKPREFDTAKVTPKVKLNDFNHIEQYSAHTSAEKMFNKIMNGQNFRSTKMTDHEMTELNKMASKQNTIAITVIVLVVILIFFIRFITVFF